MAFAQHRTMLKKVLSLILSGLLRGVFGRLVVGRNDGLDQSAGSLFLTTKAIFLHLHARGGDQGTGPDCRVASGHRGRDNTGPGVSMKALSS
jgi:hypothetical protein